MHSGKKILAFALATATVVPMMFSGCQKNNGSSPTSTDKPKETVTLQIFTGDKKIQGIDRVQQAVNDYLAKKNTGLAIKWEAMPWNDLGKKETTMLSTGQEADLINTAGWIGSGYASYASSGYLTDLTPYLTNAKNKDVFDLITKEYLDGTAVNGKYYGMPTNKEKGHNFGWIALTDELKKLNIDPTTIKTMDDMSKYFDQVKKDNLIPVCAAVMDSPFKFLDWDTMDSDKTPGALDPSEEKTVVDQFFADKTIAFYKEMKVWHDKGYFSKNVTTASSQETEMKTGKYFCGSWSLMPGKAEDESQSLGLKLTQMDVTPYEKTNRESFGCLTAIPKASKHPDQAFQFQKMLYMDKGLINLMVYGVEGKDYTKKSDNVIELKADSDFQSAGGWILGNRYNNYLTATQSPTLYKDIETYNGKCKALTSLGFAFDNTKVKNELASCQAVVDKYYPQLFYGTSKDVDATVKEFKEKLTAAGEAKLIKEMQDQYDKWLASKK